MFIIEYLNHLDVLILEYFFTRHTPFLDSYLSVVTFGGSSKFVISIAVLCAVMLYLKRQYRNSALVIIGVVGSILSTQFLKLFFMRPRTDLLFPQLDSYSFPSGHATAAMALCGIVAYLMLRHIENHLIRVTVCSLAVLIVLMIGFSRIYLGYHYITDVLGGYFVGAVWLYIVIQYSKRGSRSLNVSVKSTFVVVVTR